MIFFQIFIGNELHIGRRVDSVKSTHSEPGGGKNQVFQIVRTQSLSLVIYHN